MNMLCAPIIIVLIFLLIGSYTDVKYGIIGNKLNLIFLVLGICFNLIFTLIFDDFSFIFLSVFSGVVTFIFTYALWICGLWAGGDVKLLTAIGFTLPVNYLNYVSFMIWPFSVDLIINSIIIAFPFIILYVSVYNLRNNYGNLLMKIKYEILFFDFRKSVKRFSTYITSVDELEEGMILDNMEFNDIEVYDYISSHLNENNNLKLIDFNQSKRLNNGGSFDLNTPDFQMEYRYILKSETSAGLTLNDIEIIKNIYKDNLIPGNVFIKIALPFAPAILFAYIVTLIYGNILFILI